MITLDTTTCAVPFSNAMSRKKYIQLPHEYLSYSQMSLWLTDPVRYKALYFDKRDELRVSNSGQEYGKVVADALEKGVQTNDLLTDSAMLLLPKYDTPDQLIEAEVKTKDGWLKLIAKPDTRDSVTQAFREYKTGKHAWTQKRADEHLQMIFYAIVIWQKFGVKLDKAHLDWIETEVIAPYDQSEKIVRPTGRVESFEVVFSNRMYLETLTKIVSVAKEIEIAWAHHVPDPRYATF